MAEEFGSDEIARDGRHVDGNEGTVAALAIIMQRARHQFLTRTGFTRDHQRQVGLHQAGKNTVDFLHRRRTTHKRHTVLHVVIELGRLALRLGECAADDGDQFCQIEGLGQVIVGALFRGLDGGHEGVLSAHDENGKVRTGFLDARQKVEGVLIGHDDVRDDKIALTCRNPAPERCSIEVMRTS